MGIVSGHAELGPGYVRSAVDALLRTGADMVGGPVRAVAEGAIATAIAIATSTPYGVGGARHHYLTEAADVDTVFMGVARRETWLRYPFDEEFVRNQDDELSYRLLDDGGRIVCDPAIESSYHSRSTLRGLWHQYFDYGCWKVRVIQAHPRQARVRHLVPLALVTTLGGAALAGVVSRKARTAAALELGLYAATTTAAAVRYRDRTQPGSAALLAVTYPAVHLAYGVGMLQGLWRFRRGFAGPQRRALAAHETAAPALMQHDAIAHADPDAGGRMTADHSPRPSVTLVVAMRNEGPRIERCLASIAAQDYPAERLEVLVFDGGSTDDSAALARVFTEDRPGWEVRTNPRRIQVAAWNLGIGAASGEVLGIVSGHAELGPGYVRSAVDALLRTGADMVGGPVRAVAEGAIATAIAIATSTPYGVGGARHHYLTEAADVDTVFMGVARRETWLRYPFDEEFVLNEDDELSYRLLDDGGRIVCDPAIESSYRSRSTLRGLWHQYFGYGSWKVRVIQAHPRQARVRHLVPLALVTTLGGAALAGVVSRKARTAAALELGLYAATTTAAAVRYRDRTQPGSAALLAVTYPAVHLAYGVGMLQGLWRFRRGFVGPQRRALGKNVPVTRPGAT